MDRIVEEALALGCAEGPGRIGGRALSRQTTISASAVNYHFGGRDGLMSAVGAAAYRAQILDMRGQLHGALALPRHFQSLPGFVAAVAVTLVTRERGRTLLLLELDPPGEAAAAARDFWREAAAAFGAPDQAPVWEAFFDGVLTFAALDREPAPAAMWVARAAQRISARLERRPDPPVTEELEPRLDDGDPPAPARHPRASQIIDAAVERLLEGRTVSHRAVSEKAGIPLAATTYFFASKSEIILEAHRALYRRVMTPPAPLPAPRGIGEPFGANGELRPSYYALHRLSVAAARDPALLPVVARMRGARGRSSVDYLRLAGVPNADRLDGVIWSLCHGAVMHMTLALPLSERSGAFAARMAQTWEALFGVAMV